jgi:type VI secretion system protein ImpK
MTPNFAQAVDPIFLHVLTLLDRLQTQESSRSSEDERFAIIALFDRASAALGATDEWNLAKYALVSWIDEILLEIPWSGRDWWSNNVLEVEMFGTRLCYNQFYIRAQEASASPQRDALEVFYNCVVLGFRGIYGDPEMLAVWAPQHNLPPDLETWASRMVLAIRLGRGRPKLADYRQEIAGAPPLRTRIVLMWSWVLTLILIMCNVVAFTMWSRR